MKAFCPELPIDAPHWARRVASGALKRRSLLELDRMIDEIALRAEFGEPCDDFEPECAVCAAWAKHRLAWGGGDV